MDYEKYSGLSNEEIIIRKNKNLINQASDHITKSTKQIILSNTITFFNILNIILFILVLSVGSYKNTLFIFLIIINTLIGIYQEIKAKKILDKLSILATSKSKVIRNNKIANINIEEIVLDDYLILKSGYQVPSDCKIIEGQVEVNEALLTGESEPVIKSINDPLFSGSFIISGEVVAVVTSVGDKNYMNKIMKSAKKLKRAKSELFNSINKILKIVSFIIVPIGIALFYKEYFINTLSYHDSILKTVAALLGMVPEGLVLLTTLALTLSVIRLAKQNTLVQELYCIEMLARVDTVCLDKTGTITEGKMEVAAVDKLEDINIDEIMGNISFFSTDNNATIEAIKNKWPSNKNYTLKNKIDFSSARKFSAYSFIEKGTYYIGAPEYLLSDSNLINKCNEYSEKGFRVLALVYSVEYPERQELLSDLKPLALIRISDIIRPNAPEILKYFETQGVICKIISGDNPKTVSQIAMRAGVLGADKYIDATNLKTDKEIKEAVENYNVFGRVTPEQKKKIVIALKKNKHTVAMTGDGINDVLAFKEADCSIAMASGSDAAKRAANLVLLDNNFASMPHIVNEGRRVINNITSSSSMFLIKTMFSALIAILTIFIGESYPFEPIHLSIINAFCVAIPTFFLTYEPNFNKVQNNFLITVFKNAFPAALTITIISTIVMKLGTILESNSAMLSTICVLIAGWNYMLALEKLYSPKTKYRCFIIYMCELLYFIAMVLGKNIIGLTEVSYLGIIVLLALGHYSFIFQILSEKIFFYLIKFLKFIDNSLIKKFK